MLQHASSHPFHHSFYFDPEIIDFLPDSDSRPPMSSFSTFATGKIQLYPASFPCDPFPVYSDASERLPAMAPAETDTEALGTATTIGNVDTIQIRTFWNLYRAYPHYLQNVEKRKKRRRNRAAQQITP
jgi:hypothetical protein